MMAKVATNPHLLMSFLHMDVYKLADDMQDLNSTELLNLLPAKLATSTIPMLPELNNGTGILAANSFILLITMIFILI